MGDWADDRAKDVQQAFDGPLDDALHITAALIRSVRAEALREAVSVGRRRAQRHRELADDTTDRTRARRLRDEAHAVGACANAIEALIAADGGG